MSDTELTILISLQDQASDGLKNMQGVLKDIGKGTAEFAGDAMKAGAEAVTSFASTADSLSQLHEKTGFSAEALSTLKYALESNGLSLDNFGSAVKKMAANITDPTEEVQDSFKSLGLSVAGLQNMSPEQQFDAIGLAIGKIEDPTQRAATAAKLLGESGADMIPVFSKGQAGLDAMAAAAQKAGVVMSNDTMKSGAQLQSGLDDLQQSFQGVVAAIGSALAPSIKPLVDGFTQLVQALPLKEFGDLLARLLPPLAEALLKLLKAIPLDTVISFVEDALTPLLAVLPDILDAFSPILEILGQILKVIPIKEFMTLATDILKAVVVPVLNDLVDVLNFLMPLITLVFNSLGDAITFITKSFQGVLSFFKQVWSDIQNVFKDAINFLIGMAEGFVNGFIKGINFIIDGLDKVQVHIKSVEVLGMHTPAIDFGINIPNIPEISIPRLASGGIVTSPTLALIGESGPEAVVPLGRSTGGPPTIINVTVNGWVGSDQDIAARLREQLLRMQGRGNLGFA